MIKTIEDHDREVMYMGLGIDEGIGSLLVGGMLSICCIGDSLIVIENIDEWYIYYIFYSRVSSIIMRLLIVVVSVIYYIEMVS